VLRKGRGYASQCYIMYFASDSASIFQQFMGMTVPKRRVSEIPHPHGGQLPYLPKSCQFLVRPFGGGIVSIC